MRYKKVMVGTVILLLGLETLYAQESPTATGGEASGVGGTVSYSIGQVVYTTNIGSNGSVAKGVQQPYEIFVVTGVDENLIGLEMMVFPNPTTNYLQLKVENQKFENLFFRLYNIQGEVVKSSKIANNNITIQLENLPSSTYFLKITEENKLLKTFKIIKN